MNIDKVNQGSQIQPTSDRTKLQAKEAAEARVIQDSVSISREAILARELAQTQKVIASAPDLRADKIKEVREKLQKGEYDNLSNEVLSKVAHRLTAVVRE